MNRDAILIETKSPPASEPADKPKKHAREQRSWAGLGIGAVMLCAMLAAQFSGLLALPQSENEWWVLAVSMMTNVACGLVGCYLVLRRVSLMGDALSHAVLPGLVIAFLASGSVAIGYMLIGAFLVGLLATFLTEALHRQGGAPADASMGVVFTSLFALGVILMRIYTDGHADLDADCVLQGQLALMPQNRIDLWGWELPRAAASIGVALAVNLLFITLFWKELIISSFDPGLATTMGFRAGWMHYLLMATVAMTTVGSFEAVGSILVVAMLIVPGATAHLLTDRLAWMLWISAGVGILAAYLGFGVSAVALDIEPAGATAVAAGLIYLLAVFFSPRYGIVSAVARNARLTSQILREDLLAMLYRLEELAVNRSLGPREAVAAVGGGVLAHWGIFRLMRRGEIRREDGAIRLTERGRSRATHLVRSHRLWEAYLVEFLGLPLDHVHGPATRMEHYIGAHLQEQIAADLRHGATDPHGRQIPREQPRKPS